MANFGAEIAHRADFDIIRYAQVWEDAEVLVRAMGDVAGGRLVSIASAGDNAFALLTLDPASVTALDISPAQLECLNLRVGAYRMLDHGEFLELMGARPSDRRRALLDRATAGTGGTRDFWLARAGDVERLGAAGLGRFEGYFRLFRRWILPLTHPSRTIDEIFRPRDREQRRAFFHQRFDTWRWRLLMRLFFSRFVMARLGRDPAFFDHVQGSVANHVAGRLEHAAVDCDPTDNPYLHWILKGTHGVALPLAWQARHYDTIRTRLDRIQIRRQSLEQHVSEGVAAHGFNLSDIFEYMSPHGFAQLYPQILNAARPGARLVYWNMMAPRRVPVEQAHRVRTLTALEDELKAIDRAFFYSDFVLEEVL